METSRDREELAAELGSILTQERERVASARASLRQVEVSPSLSIHDRSALAEADSELVRATQRLERLLRSPDLGSSSIGNLVGFALRQSISARTSLLKHTPALAGAPRALDPRQHSGSGGHFIEYARSGARLFAGGSPPKIRAEDHPILRETAGSIAAVLYRALPSAALIFSSGMGAMNTAIDYLAQQARLRSKRCVIGARSWMEVREYVRVEHNDVFDLIDEADVSPAFSDPSVFGIALETIVNHPDFPVVKLVPAQGEKLVLIDSAHTPSYDPSWLSSADVTVMAVISGVKFLQAGLDLSKSGLLSIWGSAEVSDALLELRERSGRTPSYEEAHLAALETRVSFEGRLLRLDRNTRQLSAALGSRVSSPWSRDHPGHTHALSHYGTGGRFVYARVSSPFEIERALCREAVDRKIPLVSACTFGLAVPHVNVIVHPTEGSVLRLSAGSGPWEEVGPFIDLCAAILGR